MIHYRLTSQELAVLTELSGHRRLEGVELPDVAGCAEILEQLKAQMIIRVCQEQLVLDQVIWLLLRVLACPAGCFRFQLADSFGSVYYGYAFGLVIWPDTHRRDGFVLTPVRSRTDLLRAVPAACAEALNGKADHLVVRHFTKAEDAAGLVLTRTYVCGDGAEHDTLQTCLSQVVSAFDIRS